MKQKILIVHNYYKIPGGEDTVVANERKMLEEHGHQVWMYTRTNKELEQMSGLSKLLLPFTTVFNFRTFYEVKKLIRQKEIDIVHVHNTLNLISPAVYYAAKASKVPVVQTIHNFRLQCMAAVFYRNNHICEKCITKGLICAVKNGCYRDSKIQTLACAMTNWIHRKLGIYQKLSYICLTEFNKQKLLQWQEHGKSILTKEQIYIKPNFTYELQQYNSMLYEQGDYYLFIGRVEQIKGIDVLIKAFELLPEQYLKIAGTGTELEYYKGKVAEKRLNNIEFLGFLDKETLCKTIRGAKAVIVASQWYETFGMIIVEAYSCGTPVIVGDIGNISNLVEHGVTGMKFEYDNSEGLRNTILEFEQQNRRQMSENAYLKYRKEFTSDENYKQLLEIYNCVSK